MLKPSIPAERDAFGLQSEMIHVALGYHVDRVRHGHPFALSYDVTALLDEGHRGPHFLNSAINREGIKPLNIMETLTQGPTSPIDVIAKGVTASVWESFGHLYGIGLERVSEPRYFPFIADHELSDIRREMMPHTGNESYQGMGTIHSGFRVGIDTMTHFSALAEGLPEGHSLDASAVAQTFAKTGKLGLLLLKGEQLTMRFPETSPGQMKIAEWIRPGSKLGVSTDKIRTFTDAKMPGCPARMVASDRAMRILSRHGLEVPADGSSSIKILCDAIRSYVHEQFELLRAELPLGNVQAMPLFDRRVYGRSFPTA